MQITRKFFGDISDEKWEKFEKFHQLFEAKNKELNLSAIRDENGIWEKHFLDSFLAVEFLADAKMIIDLGSGGGFPLLPFAILFPEKEFFGVESVGKKCVALEYFISELGLKNVRILNGRVEELANLHAEKFDILMARAFAPFPILLEAGLPFLKFGGKIVAYRGTKNTEEEKKMPEKFGGKLTKIAEKNLPSGDGREFWIVEKREKSKMPRSWGRMRGDL